MATCALCDEQPDDERPGKRALVTMHMHREPGPLVPGRATCWADSPDLPGYTAAGEDFAAVMHLVREGLTPPACNLDQLIDLRWRLCDTPTSGRGIVAMSLPVVAVTGTGQLSREADLGCGCSKLTDPKEGS